MSRGLIVKVTYQYLSSVLLRKDCPLLLISFYLYFKPRFSPLCYIKLHFLWYISLRVFKNICGVSSFNFYAIFYWDFFKNFCDTSSFHLVSLSGTRKEIMCPWWPVNTFHNLCSPLWTPIELLTLVTVTVEEAKIGVVGLWGGQVILVENNEGSHNHNGKYWQYGCSPKRCLKCFRDGLLRWHKNGFWQWFEYIRSLRKKYHSYVMNCFWSTKHQAAAKMLLAFHSLIPGMRGLHDAQVYNGL